MTCGWPCIAPMLPRIRLPQLPEARLTILDRLASRPALPPATPGGQSTVRDRFASRPNVTLPPAARGGRPTIRDRLASRLGPGGGGEGDGEGQRGQRFDFGRNSDRMLVHENDASLSSDLLNQFQRESGESMASWSSLGQFR